MRIRPFMTGVLILTTAVALAAQSTIGQIRLAEGAESGNQLKEPVIDASQTAPIAIGTFTAAYDKKALFVRRGTSGMFGRGPEYKLDPKVDVGAVLAESLRAQASAMGFKVGESGWRLSGAVRDVYLESRQIPYGATLFYAYLAVDVQVQNPAGASSTVPMRLHHYFGGYNAGGGRRDEAETAAAQLLIEGAQDLLARLNRDHFKAPPHPSIAAKLAGIRAGSLLKQFPALRAIGLSGLPEATPALLGVLPQEKDENARATIISALASLGSPASVSVLGNRYATEDEDCRWYTLKALDYIGTDEALKVVRSAGLVDKDTGPQRLARRITGTK